MFFLLLADITKNMNKIILNHALFHHQFHDDFSLMLESK
jgi:hypothetical protein